MTDELAQIIHENFNKCRGRNGVSPSALAEEIERSDWFRKVKADAWAEGRNTAHWVSFEYRFDDNPYM